MQDFTSVENLREKRAEALNLTLFEFILFSILPLKVLGIMIDQ
jgi:hypothetical protein